MPIASLDDLSWWCWCLGGVGVFELDLCWSAAGPASASLLRQRLALPLHGRPALAVPALREYAMPRWGHAVRTWLLYFCHGFAAIAHVGK
jgi:hypothetical protein